LAALTNLYVVLKTRSASEIKPAMLAARERGSAMASGCSSIIAFLY
jgi:hypothetical protein